MLSVPVPTQHINHVNGNNNKINHHKTSSKPVFESIHKLDNNNNNTMENDDNDNNDDEKGNFLLFR